MPRRKPVAEAQTAPELPEPNPELERLLHDKAYREYLRRRIEEKFAPVVSAFLEAAETGSAVHMRMIVALLEETNAAVPAEEDNPARRLLEELEELHRQGTLSNL